MNNKYKFYIFEGGIPKIVEMTLEDMVTFIKIFGDKFKIVLVD